MGLPTFAACSCSEAHPSTPAIERHHGLQCDWHNEHWPVGIVEVNMHGAQFRRRKVAIDSEEVVDEGARHERGVCEESGVEGWFVHHSHSVLALRQVGDLDGGSEALARARADRDVVFVWIVELGVVPCVKLHRQRAIDPAIPKTTTCLPHRQLIRPLHHERHPIRAPSPAMSCHPVHDATAGRGRGDADAKRGVKPLLHELRAAIPRGPDLTRCRACHAQGATARRRPVVGSVSARNHARAACVEHRHGTLHATRLVAHDQIAHPAREGVGGQRQLRCVAGGGPIGAVGVGGGQVRVGVRAGGVGGELPRSANVGVGPTRQHARAVHRRPFLSIYGGSRAQSGRVDVAARGRRVAALHVGIAVEKQTIVAFAAHHAQDVRAHSVRARAVAEGEVRREEREGHVIDERGGGIGWSRPLSHQRPGQGPQKALVETVGFAPPFRTLPLRQRRHMEGVVGAGAEPAHGELSGGVARHQDAHVRDPSRKRQHLQLVGQQRGSRAVGSKREAGARERVPSHGVRGRHASEDDVACDRHRRKEVAGRSPSQRNSSRCMVGHRWGSGQLGRRGFIGQERLDVR
mmetsp:Transcript_17839/g.57114  ORF Transcript_17839/g.57114 Transcript_17839/m.57114 type:complete len:576 (+) Transcript_17839:411-2138(+)